MSFLKKSRQQEAFCRGFISRILSGAPSLIRLNVCKYLNYLLENLPSTKITNTEFAKLAPWNQTVIANCSGTMYHRVKCLYKYRNLTVPYPYYIGAARFCMSAILLSAYSFVFSLCHKCVTHNPLISFLLMYRTLR